MATHMQVNSFLAVADSNKNLRKLNIDDVTRLIEDRDELTKEWGIALRFDSEKALLLGIGKNSNYAAIMLNDGDYFNILILSGDLKALKKYFNVSRFDLVDKLNEGINATMPTVKKFAILASRPGQAPVILAPYGKLIHATYYDTKVEAQEELRILFKHDFENDTTGKYTYWDLTDKETIRIFKEIFGEDAKLISGYYDNTFNELSYTDADVASPDFESYTFHDDTYAIGEVEVPNEIEEEEED